jgi:hypothetical protein
MSSMVIYAYESTYKILSIPQKSLNKLINMIFDEFAKVFDREAKRH